MTEKQKEQLLQIAYKRGMELNEDSTLTFEAFKKEMAGEEGQFFLKAIIDAYNMALDDAANPSYIFEPQVYNSSFHAPTDKRVVYRETILNLKIELKENANTTK